MGFVFTQAFPNRYLLGAFPENRGNGVVSNKMPREACHKAYDGDSINPLP